MFACLPRNRLLYCLENSSAAAVYFQHPVFIEMKKPEFIQRVIKTILIHRFQQVIYAVYPEGFYCIFIVSEVKITGVFTSIVSKVSKQIPSSGRISINIKSGAGLSFTN